MAKNKGKEACLLLFPTLSLSAFVNHNTCVNFTSSPLIDLKATNYYTVCDTRGRQFQLLFSMWIIVGVEDEKCLTFFLAQQMMDIVEFVAVNLLTFMIVAGKMNQS